MEGSIVGTGYHAAGKSFNEQLWTLLPFVFMELEYETASASEKTPITPQRKDGGRWFVHGYEKRDIQVCKLGKKSSKLQGCF